MVFSILKRDFRLFLRCLLPALALTAVLAAVSAAAAFVAAKGANDLYTPIKAAIVDNEDTLLSRLLIRTTSNTDYIAGLLEIDSCDMEEAMDGLAAANVAAVVVLPEGWMDDILSGTESRGEIILSDAAAAHADLVADVAAFGELLLAAGQNGVFCGQNLLRRYELGNDFENSFLTDTNLQLLQEANASASRYFDVRVTNYADTNMSTAAYYAMNYAAFFLLLSSAFFHRLYTTDLKRPILCRLNAAGLSDAAFLLGKFLFPFLFSALLCLLLWALAPNIGLRLRLWPLLAAAAVASLLGGGIMICFDGGTALCAVFSLAGLLLCGGIVPRQLLPHSLPALGKLSPFGAVSAFMPPAFGGGLGGLWLLIPVVYCLCAVLLLRRRLYRIKLGGDAL